MTAPVDHNPSMPSSASDVFQDIIIPPAQPSATENEQDCLTIVPLPPPSYAEAQGTSIATTDAQANLHPFEISHRFPAGVFVLRNRSSLKVLDVRGGSTHVGSEVIGYTPKRPTLAGGDLINSENNQLFFLDWHGCLCAANSSFRVDVEDNRLVLSKPQPVSTRPTPESHPPPQFRYDPITRTISVRFSHDPTYSGATLQQVNSVDYLLELQPLSSHAQQTPSASTLEKLSEWLPFAKPLKGSSSEPSGLPAPAFLDTSDDPDLDDSPEPLRAVHVVSVAPGWREKFPSSGTPEARKWLKRQWDIASIVVQPRGAAPPSRSASAWPEPESPMSVLADLGEALGDLGSEISRALRRS